MYLEITFIIIIITTTTTTIIIAVCYNDFTVFIVNV